MMADRLDGRGYVRARQAVGLHAGYDPCIHLFEQEIEMSTDRYQKGMDKLKVAQEVFAEQGVSITPQD